MGTDVLGMRVLLHALPFCGKHTANSSHDGREAGKRKPT